MIPVVKHLSSACSAGSGGHVRLSLWGKGLDICLCKSVSGVMHCVFFAAVPMRR